MRAAPLIKKVFSTTGIEVSRSPWGAHFDAMHRRQALGVLNGLKSSGIYLSREVKSTCDEYAKEVLGSGKYAPWLYVYSVINGKFEEGWIPDNYYGRFVAGRRNGAYGRISFLRASTSILFQTGAVPDLLYFLNGRFFDVQMRHVRRQDVARQLFQDRDEVIFKADNSQQGKAIHFFRKDGFDESAIFRIGDGVFQIPVRQHELLESFGSGAVATLRLTTVIDQDGDASLRSAYLRLGRSGERSVRVGSLVRVAVDMRTGELSPLGYLPSWKACEEHPDSGKAFGQSFVPNFSECAELVVGLHARMPFVQSIGWDLAIGADEGIFILEWNGEHNDIKFSEATQGPCFADLGWENLWKQ